MKLTRRFLIAENNQLRAQLAAAGNTEGRQKLRDRLAETRTELAKAQVLSEGLGERLAAAEKQIAALKGIALPA